MEKSDFNSKNDDKEMRERFKEDYIIDMHCHSALKPYGRSTEYCRKNAENSRRNNSIWHYDPPTRTDKRRNRWLGITRFSQTNFTALAKGNVKIICATLYPIEKGYSQLWGRTGRITDWLIKFVVEIGYARINEIQEHQNYFKDLMYEYKFYKKLHGKKIKLKNLCKKKWQYRLTKDFKDIEENLHKKKTISVVMSIEGTNVFNTGLKRCSDENEVISHVSEVKKWEYLPLFITFAHHFNNDLCGHAKSFSKIISHIFNQKKGLGEGFKPLGWKVLKELLSNKDNNRIYIDIKHMSRKSRVEYYEFVDSLTVAMINEKINILDKAMNIEEKAREQAIKVALKDILDNEKQEKNEAEKRLKFNDKYDEEIKEVLKELKDNEVKNEVQEIIKGEIFKALNEQIAKTIEDLEQSAEKNTIKSELEKKIENASKIFPIIVSHGAVNGLELLYKKNGQGKNTKSQFNTSEVNIFDDEIVRICKSGGFLGIQPDKRRIYGEEFKKWAKRRAGFKNRIFNRSVYKRRLRYYMAKFVWNQIEHIAEVLDKAGCPSWDTATLGSDFDGLVKPIEGCWTAEDFGLLRNDLILHACDFKAKPKNHEWEKENEEISAKEIIDKFMFKNARRFLKEYHRIPRR